MKAISHKLVLKGSYFTATTVDQVEYQQDRLVCIDEEGRIGQIIAPDEAGYQGMIRQAQGEGTFWELAADQYLLPGFIDLHVHAPQWPNAGLALDRPLNEWLSTYTFPLEAKFSNADFAAEVYADLVETLLANGTTTALYFGSVANAGNLELVKACLKQGQRGFVGKVVMDDPDQTPDYYRDSSAQQALQDTEDFILQTQKLTTTSQIKVTPVVMPRFLPSCSPEALAGLGQLAQKYDLPIQSHCSESDWENGYALSTYGKRDAEVLDHFGLLTEKSVMAHGTLLNQDDLALFRQRGTGIAHCPISNAYFGNAVLPAKQVVQQQVKIGLGTDISGGFDPSVYQNLRQALISARMLSDGVDHDLAPEKRGTHAPSLTAQNAFYLATRGGAASLNLPTGQIKPGYFADLQVVHSKYATFMQQSEQDIFEKVMYHTTASEIDQVLVQGQLVVGEKIIAQA